MNLSRPFVIILLTASLSARLAHAAGRPVILAKPASSAAGAALVPWRPQPNPAPMIPASPTSLASNADQPALPLVPSLSSAYSQDAPAVHRPSETSRNEGSAAPRRMPRVSRALMVASLTLAGLINMLEPLREPRPARVATGLESVAVVSGNYETVDIRTGARPGKR